MLVQHLAAIRPKPSYVNALSLTGGGAAESTTVPAGYNLAVFSYTAQAVYVRVGATAVVPGDVTDGTAAELAPLAYRVSVGDVISFIASADAKVTIAFYFVEGGL